MKLTDFERTLLAIFLFVCGLIGFPVLLAVWVAK